MSALGGLFGSGGKEIKTSTQTGRAMDLRTAVEGTLSGTLIGPAAIVSGPGITTKTGDFSPLTQQITGNKFKLGMSGTEVSQLLQQQGSLAAENLARVSDFAGSSLAAVSATRTGDLPNWQRYIPLLIGAAVIVVIWRKR